MHRQMHVAAAEENFLVAASMRDEYRRTLDQLPPVQQFMYQQVLMLSSPDASLKERADAVSGLGTSGDPAALPHLVALLASSDLAPLHDAAQDAMWAIFMQCRDPTAQEALAEGTALMGRESRQGDAMRLFDEVVKRCPTYAEGYNKKATLLYLQRRFCDAIAECRRALELQPYHFGAASGMGLCHLQLGEHQKAVAAFDIALSINPTLADIRSLHGSLKKSLAETAAEAGGGGGSSSGSGGGSPMGGSLP
mmetsp:Transcript_18083/g.54056  ORF Transcript_18083/g.54056 Transcript_18083/m.54056 type:complete len:251 (-) Transcript_18083:215-967(-)